MRILLVDDDTFIIKAIGQSLRRQTYAVDVATTGEDGLHLASENVYDLIILDVILPDANGIDICRVLRTAGSRIPILMLTALDDVDNRIGGLDAGADDYLTKPFAVGELLARVRALLRRSEIYHHSTLQVADLISTLTREKRHVEIE